MALSGRFESEPLADELDRRPIQGTDPGMLEVVASYRKRGRPPVENPKMRIGFRLAADVFADVRASGRGFNARVEKVLRDALANGKL